jgi:hypothetical protein
MQLLKMADFEEEKAGRVSAWLQLPSTLGSEGWELGEWEEGSGSNLFQFSSRQVNTNTKINPS